MEIKEIQSWMEGYIKAWNTNDPEDIGRLFSTSARYFTAPYRRPWIGQEQIVAGWLGRKDEPGDFDFRYDVLGADGARGFVRGWTVYFEPPREYSNLWVLTFNDRGKCEEFIEWWMEHE